MPTAAAKFSFPKEHRLKSSLLIKETVQQRKSVFCFPIKCFYSVRETPGAACNVAFLVSKKRFAHAVDRNRVKRLLREAYRLHSQEFTPISEQTVNLCWMFVGETLPTFTQVEEAARRIFAELQTVLNPDRQ